MYGKNLLESISGDSEGNVSLTYTTSIPVFDSPISISSPMFKFVTYEKNSELERYIINENATILFWDDNTKTISKRHEDDKFDKELGFLFAYFYKKYKGSNASRKRVIDSINYKKIKTFLFEFYVNDSEKTYDQARKYLTNLQVEK